LGDVRLKSHSPRSAWEGSPPVHRSPPPPAPRPPALRLMPTLTRILPMATGMSRSRVPRALSFGCASSPLAVALGTPSTTHMGRPLPDGKKTWVRTIGILGTHGRGLPLRTRTIETPQSPRVLLPLQPAKMPPPLPGPPPTEAGRDVDCATAHISIAVVAPGDAASKAPLVDMRCPPQLCTAGPSVLTPWVLPPSTYARTLPTRGCPCADAKVARAATATTAVA
jgi:hypothetical protein